MTASEDLFKLIHSLSKSEKRHFVLFASKHIMGEQNDYMKIFYEIQNQKKYNEEEVKKKLPAALIKRFAVAKNYLYSLILKSLRVYYTTYNATIQLKEILTNVQVLYNKELLKQCLKQLKKARILAEAHEEYLALIEVTNWEVHIYRKLRDTKRMDWYLNHYESLISRSIQFIQNDNEYDKLFTNISYLQGKNNIIRTAREENMFKQYVDTALFKDDKKAFSFSAKNKLYSLRSSYYFINGKLGEYFNSRKKQVQLWESNPIQIKNKYPFYMATLFNMLLAQLRLHKYKEAFGLLEKINKMNIQDPVVKSNLLGVSTEVKYKYYINKNDYKSLMGLLEEIENHIKGESDRLNWRWKLDFFFYGFSICFRNKKYRDALLWLNRILNSDIKFIPDLDYGMAKVLGLILYYELKHFDLLEDSVRSVHRFLHKRGKLFVIEKSILQLIGKLISGIDEKQHITELKLLRKQVIAIANKSSAESRIVDKLDILWWIDNKLKTEKIEL